MSDHTPSSIRIQLTQGQSTIIDAADADLATKRWQAHFNPEYGDGGQFVAMRSIRLGKSKIRTEYLHRAILSRVLRRELLRSEQVDHINRDPLDNRRANLRLASNAENCRNRRRPENNTSGYKGVIRRKGYDRWRARIGLNGKRLHIGDYSTPEEAARAYDRVARELYGEFALLNFPDAAHAAS